jgi:hypothetical protein
MNPAPKPKRPKRVPRPRNPEDPREKACRKRCKDYGIPPDAIHEDRPMWTRFLDEVETALNATGGKMNDQRGTRR